MSARLGLGVAEVAVYGKCGLLLGSKIEGYGVGITVINKGLIRIIVPLYQGKIDHNGSRSLGDRPIQSVAEVRIYIVVTVDGGKGNGCTVITYCACGNCSGIACNRLGGNNTVGKAYGMHVAVVYDGGAVWSSTVNNPLRICRENNGLWRDLNGYKLRGKLLNTDQGLSNGNLAVVLTTVGNVLEGDGGSGYAKSSSVLLVPLIGNGSIALPYKGHGYAMLLSVGFNNTVGGGYERKVSIKYGYQSNVAVGHKLYCGGGSRGLYPSNDVLAVIGGGVCKEYNVSAYGKEASGDGVTVGNVGNAVDLVKVDLEVNGYAYSLNVEHRGDKSTVFLVNLNKHILDIDGGRACDSEITRSAVKVHKGVILEVVGNSVKQTRAVVLGNIEVALVLFHLGYDLLVGKTVKRNVLSYKLTVKHALEVDSLEKLNDIFKGKVGVVQSHAVSYSRIAKSKYLVLEGGINVCGKSSLAKSSCKVIGNLNTNHVNAVLNVNVYVVGNKLCKLTNHIVAAAKLCGNGKVTVTELSDDVDAVGKLHISVGHVLDLVKTGQITDKLLDRIGVELNKLTREITENVVGILAVGDGYAVNEVDHLGKSKLGVDVGKLIESIDECKVQIVYVLGFLEKELAVSDAEYSVEGTVTGIAFNGRISKAYSGKLLDLVLDKTAQSIEAIGVLSIGLAINNEGTKNLQSIAGIKSLGNLLANYGFVSGIGGNRALNVGNKRFVLCLIALKAVKRLLKNRIDVGLIVHPDPDLCFFGISGIKCIVILVRVLYESAIKKLIFDKLTNLGVNDGNEVAIAAAVKPVGEIIVNGILNDSVDLSGNKSINRSIAGGMRIGARII